MRAVKFTMSCNIEFRRLKKPTIRIDTLKYIFYMLRNANINGQGVPKIQHGKTDLELAVGTQLNIFNVVPWFIAHVAICLFRLKVPRSVHLQRISWFWEGKKFCGRQWSAARISLVILNLQIMIVRSRKEYYSSWNHMEIWFAVYFNVKTRLKVLWFKSHTVLCTTYVLV